MTIVEFIKARLDEDEQAAKRVPQPYRLYVCDDGHVEEPMRVDDPWGERNGEYQQWELGEDRLPNHHNSWALIYDPARVLAEVASKRRIVDEHPLHPAACPPPDVPDYGCETCHFRIDQGVGPFGECDTLKFLALPWSGHPDYDEAWRP